MREKLEVDVPERLNSLYNGISSGRNSTPMEANNTSNMTQYFFKEVSDMRERENNLVIYGVSEATSQEVKERVEHDKRLVKSLMQLCQAEYEECKFFVFRLGIANPNSGKPRPLKQRDSQLKQAIFRNIKKL